jgi:V8-like Glu-specific endopeptidase
MDEESASSIYVNGINGTRGGYLVPPLSPEQALDLARIDEKGRGDHSIELKRRNERDTTGSYALGRDRDPRNLEEAGWGVIFPYHEDAGLKKRQEAIREALKPLLGLRKAQASAGGNDHFYREYIYPPGKTKQDFLAANGVGVGLPVYPEYMPYYLLIVADPEEVPFRFQYELDVEYAVGRIAFDTVEEYARYAQSVAETDRTKIVLPRRATFVAARNRNVRATELSSENLVPPLFDVLGKELHGWGFDRLTGHAATKDALAALFNAQAPPSLLFSASHGMGFERQDRRQSRHQGSLLCSDCPDVFHGQIDEKYYVSADDVGGEASLLGTIAFFFACFGAGTPQLNDFPHEEGLQSKNQIADRPFVAALPRKLLAHPRGGALAVIGHVERAWASSFLLEGSQPQVQAFRTALKLILSGYPIGAAMDVFNERYAALATALTGKLDKVSIGQQLTPAELANTASLWTAHNDARSYVVLGDPAVRLFTGDAPEGPRPALTMKFQPGIQSIPSTPVTDVGTEPPPVASGGDLPFDSALIAAAEERFREVAADRPLSFAPGTGAASPGALLGSNPRDALTRRLRRIGLTPEAAEQAADRATSTSFAVGSRGPLAGHFGLERILGRNMLLGIQYLDSGRLAARTVARVVIRDGVGRTSGFGTGSLVAPGLFLTNNHVLGSIEEAKRSLLQFDYQNSSDGRMLAPATFAVDPDAFFVTSPLDALDFTLVGVKSTSDDGRPLADFGYNRLGALSGEVVAGESVTIIQHPNGEPKQIALRENLVIKLPRADDRFLHYQTDTTPGSSGSPVYNDQWEMVALHHAGAPRKNNREQILARDGTAWTQSMGEQAIDWVANEGVRVAAIVSVLRGATNLGQSQTALLQPILDAAAAETAGPMPVSMAVAPVAGGHGARGVVPLVANVTGNASASAGGNSVTWTVPIEITVRFDLPGQGGPQ